MAYSVGSPAEEGAVVEVRERGVGHDGRGAVTLDTPGRDPHPVGTVVECPAVGDVRRVRVHLAGDVDSLLLRHAVDSRL